MLWLFWVSGCGLLGGERAAQALSERVRREIRPGDLNRALALADQGWARWRDRGDTVLHWEFRLLRA